MIRLALIATLFVFAPLLGWADVYPFDAEAIGKAPKKHGIYRLYRQSELI